MELARLGPRILRGRDTSHGCQNHTTWPYAARSTPSLNGLGTLPPKSDARRFSIGRRRAVPSLTKPQEGPPCDDVCAPDAAASTAPRPAFSDDRETPLLGDGMAEVVGVIWGKREADYFCGRSIF